MKSESADDHRPLLTGAVWVGFSVSDLERTIEWYERVLGFEVTGRKSWDTAHGAFVRDPSNGLTIGLYQHLENDSSPFDELRCGLDHLELMVPDEAALLAWVQRLDRLGVEHSGIKMARIVTLRDPDNIQLELFVPSNNSG